MAWNGTRREPAEWPAENGGLNRTPSIRAHIHTITSAHYQNQILKEAENTSISMKSRSWRWSKQDFGTERGVHVRTVRKLGSCSGFQCEFWNWGRGEKTWMGCSELVFPINRCWECLFSEFRWPLKMMQGQVEPLLIVYMTVLKCSWCSFLVWGFWSMNINQGNVH